MRATQSKTNQTPPGGKSLAVLLLRRQSWQARRKQEDRVQNIKDTSVCCRGAIGIAREEDKQGKKTFWGTVRANHRKRHIKNWKKKLEHKT